MLFFFPLYYQFYKVPPPYPFKYANWVAIAYTVDRDRRDDRRRDDAAEPPADLDRVYVEDETHHAAGCRSSISCRVTR